MMPEWNPGIGSKGRKICLFSRFSAVTTETGIPYTTHPCDVMCARLIVFLPLDNFLHNVIRKTT
jgi:hypothetical protein